MSLRERAARAILLGLDGDAKAEVIRDLQELAGDRGGASGSIYFWAELVKYPIQTVWDRLRHGPAL